MAHSKTDNTMKPRAIDSIFLRPTGTADGSFYVLNLDTGQRVRRRAGTSAHVTSSVINRVEELAKAEGMPEGMIFSDRKNENVQTIHDIETDSIDSMDDDDDASDASFKPNEDDDGSVDTTLSGVAEEEDDVQAEAQALRNDITTLTAPNRHVTRDRGNVTVIENETMGEPATNMRDRNGETDADHRTMSRNEPEAQEWDSDKIMAQQPDEEKEQECADAESEKAMEQDPAEESESIPDDKEEEIDFTANDDGEADPIKIVHPEIEAKEGNISEEGGYNLRGSVSRINAKTFENTRHQRSLLSYTRGYGKAIAHIEKQHRFYSFLQATVEGYNNIDALPVTPQYGVERGLREFKEKGTEAVLKELQQIHDMDVITPKHPSEMTKEDIANALPYLMFLKRKRCGKVKGRGCADGRGQREFISKDEASSPTASLYAIILTALVDAIEERYVITTDIPGAFLQTEMLEEEIVYIKITGSMAELLERINPELYSSCIVTTRKGRKILFAKANKAIYGTLKAALLFWRKLRGKLEDWGFEGNPYDPCVTGRAQAGFMIGE